MSCAVDDATKNMLDAARIGRQTANGPEAQVKRASTQRKNALAQHAWKSSDQPAWLTEKFYFEKVQPLLRECRHPLSRDKSRFRAGTLAASARGTDRIRGTGWHWRTWLELQDEASALALGVLRLSGLTDAYFQNVTLLLQFYSPAVCRYRVRSNPSLSLNLELWR